MPEEAGHLMRQKGPFVFLLQTQPLGVLSPLPSCADKVPEMEFDDSPVRGKSPLLMSARGNPFLHLVGGHMCFQHSRSEISRLLVVRTFLSPRFQKVPFYFGFHGFPVKLRTPEFLLTSSLIFF